MQIIYSPKIMTAWVVRVLLVWLGLSLSVGCRGPIGPSGKDAEGVDIIPPTVQLTKPRPLSEEWDELEISAAAVDNVSIREVIFNIDGASFIAGMNLSVTEPPYSKTIDAVALEPGWHFVGARAFDAAGNFTDTPLVPVRVGLSSDLQDTLVTVKYHNSNFALSWALPDSEGVLSYWVRFSIARECYIKEADLMLSAGVEDSALVSIEVWEGETAPEDSVGAVIIPGSEIDTLMSSIHVDFGIPGLLVNNDFFIMLTMQKQAPQDTVWIGSDVGVPFWERSGSFDEEGWHTLYERYARQNNLIISSVLYYDGSQDTTARRR